MLAHNLKVLRQRQGLSQEELAARLHVVRQTVSKWEKGLSAPDAQMLPQIADALNTTVDALLGMPVEEAEEQAAATIEARLEVLNEQLNREKERRRKLLRLGCCGAAALSAALLMLEVAGVVHYHQSNAAMRASEAIIGGADQPTSIFLSSAQMPVGTTVLLLLVAAASVYGLFRTRRK